MVCPYCGSSRYSSLDKGAARCCVKRVKATLSNLTKEEQQVETDRARRTYAVSKVRGKWYKRHPIDRVINAFSARMRQPNQQGEWWQLHRQERMLLVPSIVTLLNKTEWDEDLAVRFIDIRFKDWFSHKRCESFFQIIASSKMSTHLARARRELDAEREAKELQQKNIEAASSPLNQWMSHVYATSSMDAM